MEELYVGNLASDTTEEEILALLILNSTTYFWEISLGRRQYTDNWRFNACVHMLMPQQFIERVLELNGLKSNSLEFVIQSLTKQVKLKQVVRVIIIDLFGISKVREGIRLSEVKIIGSSNQYRMKKSLQGKESIRLALSTSQKLPPESSYELMWKQPQGQKL